jgi:hypothetical protein
MENIELGSSDINASAESKEQRLYPITLRKPVFDYFTGALTDRLSALRQDGKYSDITGYLSSDEGRLAEKLYRIMSSIEYRDGYRTSLGLTRSEFKFLKASKEPDMNSAAGSRLYNEMIEEFQSDFNLATPLKDKISDLKSNTGSTARRLLEFLSRIKT